MKKLFLLVVLFLVHVRFFHAQVGTFNVLNVKYHLNPSWFISAEGQIRSLKTYNEFHYHEFTLGPSYKVNKQITLTLVAGKYDTYREGGNFVTPKPSDEFRVWPQLTLHQSIGPIKIDQRYRFEMRFTQSGFTPRFRYRLALQYPFGKAKNDMKPFQIALSNELFFFNKEPYFQRNRVSGTLQFKFNPLISTQVGWVHQFDYKINDEIGRDFLFIGCFFDLYRKEKSRDDSDDLF
jgi:hypothetical protein